MDVRDFPCKIIRKCNQLHDNVSDIIQSNSGPGSPHLSDTCPFL